MTETEFIEQSFDRLSELDDSKLNIHQLQLLYLLKHPSLTYYTSNYTIQHSTAGGYSYYLNFKDLSNVKNLSRTLRNPYNFRTNLQITEIIKYTHEHWSWKDQARTNSYYLDYQGFLLYYLFLHDQDEFVKKWKENLYTTAVDGEGHVTRLSSRLSVAGIDQLKTLTTACNKNLESIRREGNIVPYLRDLKFVSENPFISIYNQCVESNQLTYSGNTQINPAKMGFLEDSSVNNYFWDLKELNDYAKNNLQSKVSKFFGGMFSPNNFKYVNNRESIMLPIDLINSMKEFKEFLGEEQKTVINSDVIKVMESWEEALDGTIEKIISKLKVRSVKFSILTHLSLATKFPLFREIDYKLGTYSPVADEKSLKALASGDINIYIPISLGGKVELFYSKYEFNEVSEGLKSLGFTFKVKTKDEEVIVAAPPAFKDKESLPKVVEGVFDVHEDLLPPDPSDIVIFREIKGGGIPGLETGSEDETDTSVTKKYSGMIVLTIGGIRDGIMKQLQDNKVDARSL